MRSPRVGADDGAGSSIVEIMSLPLQRLLGTLTAGALVVTLAACGDDDGTKTTGSDDSSSASAPASSTPTDDVETPAGTPSETADSETPSATTAPAPEGLAARLLAAEALPAVDGAAWTVESTEPDDGDEFGACSQFGMIDLGATEAVEREFAGGEGADAAQLVAEFADPKSAWRALEVLKSWREQCVANNDDVATVSALTALPGSGTALHYLVTGTDPQEFESVAMSRSGKRISIVTFDFEGRAVPTPDPAADAAKAALALL